MQVTEAEASGLKRAFQVVVPAADLAGKQDARIAELAKTMQLPGFRPGKVPVALVRQRYGKAVLGEVLEGTVGEVAQKVVSDRGLRPAQQPEIKRQVLQKADVPDGKKFEVAKSDRLTSGSSQQIIIPDNAIPDASRLFVKVYPGVMSQILEGAEGLIRLPGG